MKRLVTSLSVHDRLHSAEEFLRSFPQQEILVVAATRTAADEFVRRSCGPDDGLFGIHRLTLPLLAFTIASEELALAGVAPLAGIGADAVAARAVHACRLKAGLGWFDPVATTPGFFRALASTITDLRLQDIDGGRLGGVLPSGQDVANLLEQFSRHLRESRLADLAAVYKTARAVIGSPDFRFRDRPLLLLDVIPSSVLERETIRSLVHTASAVFATAHLRDQASIGVFEDVLGVAAEQIHAAQPHRALDRLRANIFEPAAHPGAMDSSVDFVSATDESRECVEIARAALSLARSGLRFDRMAILLRNPNTYQPLVEDALRRAGIPGFYTLGTRRPNPAGRALLALLACASEGLSATRFSEYLSLGQVPIPDVAGSPPRLEPAWVPVQGELFPVIAPEESAEVSEEDMTEKEGLKGGVKPDGESPVISGSLRAPYQWERLLVDAAVIGGRDRWLRRLDGLDGELRRRIGEVRADDDSKREHLERQVQRLGYLRRFALPVIEFLDDFPDQAIWNDWLDRLERLAGMCLRRPEAVLSLLGELRPMGSVGPVGLAEIREVLSERLAFLRTEPPGRRYGKMFVGTISEAAGLSFEAVFLPGLAEDIFPKKTFEDPLLLDAARRSVSPVLPVQETRIARERLLLHVAAGAAQSILWVSYPRMDLSQGRARSPSFYALDVLRAITGKVPDLRELERLGAVHSQSRIGWPAPRDSNTAIDDAEYDLAVISAALRLPAEDAHGRGRYLLTANASLGRSLRTRADRWRRRWTEGDGIIASSDGVRDALSQYRPVSRPYSVTALQTFAACPYRFVLYAVYRLQRREEIVAIERMDALTRGSLFHEVQFRLLSELRARALLPVSTENFDQVIGAADSVLNKTAELYREELAPAILRIWESEVENIRWDLRGWLRLIAENTAESGNGAWTPRWFELSFGLPPGRDADPASCSEPVKLKGGIRVRGAIDMVEERAGTIRITDHKTGKALAQPPGITGHGEILQPVLYAQAAEAILRRPAESARLFFCTERGGYRLFEVSINEQSRESLWKVTSVIDQFIHAGFLPAAPREGACVWCDYRLICGPYEEDRTRRKPPGDLALLQELRDAP